MNHQIVQLKQEVMIGEKMVRVNCGIEPEHLADQHLVAEYREILLAFGYYDNNGKDLKTSDNNLKHPIRFYNDKRIYLIERFFDLKQEMINRGMKPTKDIILKDVDMSLFNKFIPGNEHINRIKRRVMRRINEKPNWYRYCGTYQPPEFFEELMK